MSRLFSKKLEKSKKSLYCTEIRAKLQFPEKIQKKHLTSCKFSGIIKELFETLAQSVEHTPFKRRVEGSNPSCLTSGQFG